MDIKGNQIFYSLNSMYTNSNVDSALLFDNIYALIIAQPPNVIFFQTTRFERENTLKNGEIDKKRNQK